MPFNKVLFSVFIILCAVQLLFPMLAARIKARFRELGYEMESNTMWSMFNVTNFWSEARKYNRKHKDPEIAKLLFLRTAWWVLTLAVFIGLIAN